jgi:hypothetical protein
MNHERDIRHNTPVHQSFLKQMRVHSISCLSYVMETRLEWRMLGLFPVTKCIMWNPMSGESSIN